VVQYFHDRMNRSGFGVIRSVHQAFQAGMDGRAGTHGARLNCNKQLAVSQTMVAQLSTSLAQGDDFRVGSGVGVGQIPIPALANNFARVNDDGAHGNFTRFERTMRGAEGFFHPEFVVGGGLRLLAIPHRRWVL
jgi:hypothetical protein